MGCTQDAALPTCLHDDRGPAPTPDRSRSLPLTPLRSKDSATRRAREAAARLKDYGEEEEGGEAATSKPAAAGAAAGLLPSATAAFGKVDGPPAFLDPEATRQLATVVHRPVSNVGADGGALPNPASANRLLNKRGQAAGEWDVSRMAPKLREEA